MKLTTLLTVAIFALVFQGFAAAAIDRLADQGAASTPSTASREGNPANKADKPENQVELYVTSWCPYCKQAENFFRSRGIAYTAYDIEKDSSAARRKEQLDSRGGVPLAIINGQKIHGFSEALYREALKKP